MNEPKTPNLGLNKIDRSSPSKTYFDLDKYLDQNWEKVDGFAEQVEGKAEETAAQVSGIQERLDTEKRRSVTLEPGLQIINAERASPFKLEGLKGRTLVNLLGRAGGCEDLSKIGVYQSTLSLDSTNKVQGSNGLKMTIDSGTSGIGYFNVALKGGRFYVAIAEVKNGNGTSVYINLAGVGAKGNPVTDTTKFNVTWTRYTPPSDMTLNVDVGVVGTAVGQFGYADAVRLYEVSAVEYAALANMTPEQINAKYPYVDSVQPVRNPYAIRYGENLLPPFYEWGEGITSGSTTVNNPNQLTMNKADGVTGFNTLAVRVNAAPLTDYTLSIPVDVSNIGGTTTQGVYWNAAAYGEGGALLQDVTLGPFATTNGTFTMGRSFKTPADTKYLRFVLGMNDLTTGTTVFKDVSLNIGTTTKPFKPREDAMLALQTDLFADPLTETNADEVFEKDGQYFKLAKWRKEILDGTKAWTFSGSYTGYKLVYYKHKQSPINRSSYGVKYDGKYLPEYGGTEKPDTVTVDNVSVYTWLSSTDTGWGDSYTPTPDEIKAYFMGWRMRNWNDLLPYIGTGEKAWGTVVSGGAAYWTATLPTTQAFDWTPYQLVYQLATPTIEPITSEGQLTLIEGDNQVEVGTGIVLRESIKPLFANDYYRFNDTTLAGSTLKNKLSKQLFMFRNNQLDYGWEFISDQYAYGAYKARKAPSRYDVSAAYSITYLMLDTSPAAPFVGSVSENEKALLTNMNDIIRQNASAVSVIEAAVNEAVRIMAQNKRNVWGEIL
ncbi:hypothetical protein [Paenibacillus illinoisensis]|uniref:hypothetical protein n=1 Tax=Paenibacillus illinoisensis TaxID=59845 RepID=UPI003D967E0F